jgi:hypothetical protein
VFEALKEVGVIITEEQEVVDGKSPVETEGNRSD